jgi:hypothetical protein
LFSSLSGPLIYQQRNRRIYRLKQLDFPNKLNERISMKIIRIIPVQLILVAALFAVPFLVTKAFSQSGFFTSAGCNATGCHVSPVVATCNGCHGHGAHANSSKNTINVAGATNKASYAPGETVTVTINGGYRTGWFRAVLYDQNSVEVARSTGNDSGMGSSATYPATLSAPAPATAGTYTWKVAWYGNQYDVSGATFGAGWTPDATNPGHGYEIVSTNSFTVSFSAAAMIGSTPYATLADAYTAATSGATIKLMDINMAGTLAVDKDVVLDGGYNNALFTTKSGQPTTLSGPLTVNTGILTVADIAVM